MNDFIPITADYRTVYLAARPVTLAEFQAFLHEAGRPLPQGVRRAPANAPGGSEPVIGVTQLDAAAYCEWFGHRSGRPCRLPSTDELDGLMPHTTVSHAHGVVPDAGFWPHERGQLAELRGGLEAHFPLRVDARDRRGPSSRDPERAMAGIFYPAVAARGRQPAARPRPPAGKRELLVCDVPDHLRG